MVEVSALLGIVSFACTYLSSRITLDRFEELFLCGRACLHLPLSCAATLALDTNSRMFRRHFRRCANGSKFQVLIHNCLFCPKDVRDIHISSDARSSTIQSQGFGVLFRAVRARSAASIKVDRDGVSTLPRLHRIPTVTSPLERDCPRVASARPLRAIAFSYIVAVLRSPRFVPYSRRPIFIVITLLN